MVRIEVLPPALASQIAAGEVVERPASAAKELIENAIDAGASRCDVSCAGGGIGSLSVSDDGVGMSRDDAVLSIQRHATSKLRSISDLNHLSTFGFRGEALPSIASVSRFTLRTRPANSDRGCIVQVDGGREPVVRHEGMPIGTTVVVNELFYNVPARRKFLRSTGTESAHITATVEGAALARPDVTFTLERDGRKIREHLRVNSRRERVIQLLDEEDLAEVKGERGPLRLEAHLCRPERARPGATGLWLLVNGRVVRDRMIAATVAQAYGSAIASGNYPRGVVYLDLAPELVDVNVHPQKSEVRFVDPRALADAMYTLLSRSLATAFAIPQASRGARYAHQRPSNGSRLNELPVERGAIPIAKREDASPARSSSKDRTIERSDLESGTATSGEFWPNPAPPARMNGSKNAAADEGRLDGPSHVRPAAAAENSLERSLTDALEDELEEPPPTMLTPSSEGPLTLQVQEPVSEPSSVMVPKLNGARRIFGRLRFLAQLKSSYLVCEGKDGLYVLDQHALAERVAYTKLLAQYRSRSTASQTLLFPVMMDLSPKEVTLIESHGEVFRDLGLDVRPRGPDRISVHSTPRLLPRASADGLVRDLVIELGRKGSSGSPEVIERAIAVMACHGSLRMGEALTAQQAQGLLGALDEVDISTGCAHGRPVLATLRFDDLERQVGRK